MATYEEYIASAIQKLSTTRPVIWESDRKRCRMQCVNPDHKGGREATPSLRINVVKDKYPAGSAHCWSCGIHYSSWNKLTEALFRPDLATNDQNNYEDPIKVSSFFAKEDEEDNDPDPIFHRDLLAGTPWVYNQEWRGINGQLLLNINARMYFDTQLEVPMLYLPCAINKQEVGGVKAYIKPPKKGLKYINTRGSWVKSRGLLGFDLVKKMLRKQKLKTVMIGEGPRDALHPIQHGIPALPILGSNNFNETKADILLSLNLKRIITCFDPDSSGDNAKKLVYKYMQSEVEVVNFNLHKWQTKLIKDGEWDQAKKLDPGAAPQRVLKAIKKHLI